MAIVLCKSRVLYLGSAIPLETAVGIEAVQSPLNQRYNPDYNNRVSAIDATLTVYSNGLRLEFPGDSSFTAWMPIQTLHVCAAVKPVMTSIGTRFLPLDDAPASSSIQHPPIFACIMRRTRGVKVLDCHGFICKSNEVALTVVHATMHAYQHREGWTSDTDIMINYSRSDNCSGGFGAAMNARNSGFGCHHQGNNNNNNNMNSSSMQQNSCGSFFRQDLVSTFNINACDTSFASQFPQPPVEKPSPPAPVQPPPAPAQPAVQVTAPITTPTVTVPQTIAVQPTQILTQATTLVPQFTIQQQRTATVVPYATQIPTMQFPMMQQPMPARLLAEEYFADWDEYGGEAVMFNPESPFYPGEEYVEKMNKGKKKKKDDKKKHKKGKGDGSSADDEETMYYVKRSGGQGKGGVSESDVIRLTNSLENRCQVESNQYETSRNGGKHCRNASKDSKVSKAKCRGKTTESSEDENVELYYMKVPKNKCATSGETVTKEVVQTQQTERVKEPESSPQETVTVSRIAVRLDDIYESHLPDENVDYADIQRPNCSPYQPPVDYDQSPQPDYIIQGCEYFGGPIPNQTDFMPFPPFQQQQPYGDVYGQSNGMGPEGQYLAPRDFYMNNPIPPNPMLDHLLNNDYGNIINGLGYYP